MGIRKQLKSQAAGLSQKALERLFADEKRAQRVAELLGRAQQAKQTLDATQRTVMHQFSFATKQDFKDLGRQLSALKRRLNALDEKLSRL